MPENDIEKEAKSIFMNALDCSTAADRREHVRSACGDNGRLREHVETLLQAHDAPAVLLEPPAIDLADPSHPTEGPGTVIGRYKLLELIGEGGFGAVYRAEQTEPVRREVALKIIKLGMDTKEVIARFEAERQALAMMEHPNIAKVLDAGATETGRPYFVMELVRGVPITEFCDDSTLTTKERLKLFIAVCHAVRHAHQKGIIHRDIKPTNVMVTLHDGQPVPKIIDFGIAKATQQRLTEKTLHTGDGQMIGTPQYMSPEQAEMCDQDIDTRTDIYSLGVLLYELLVGTTPFEPDELSNVGYSQMCRIIRETDPPTPSRRLSTLGDALTTLSQRRQVQPAVLRKQLQGDLDWIVMRALEKDRTRRYETVDALALDTERYLNEEPVLARAPSTAYRLKKFVFKHRIQVAAAAAVLASLIVGLILAIVGLSRASHERRIAVVEKHRANDYSATLARQLYVSNVNTAYHAWEKGNIKQARGLLSRHVPGPDGEDLRGFEWHFLWGQLERTAAIPTFEHEDAVLAVAWSPDGKIVASGCRDHTVKLWDITARKLLGTLTGHSGPVASVAFSSDGQILASGGADNTVRMWRLPTHALLAKLTGHTAPVTSVAFSPDGKFLASASADHSVKLWRVGTNALRHTLTGHLSSVNSVSFSPDSRILVSGSSDHTVRLWDAPTGREQKVLEGHDHQIHAVAYSPIGATLASGGYAYTLKLWDARGGDVKHTRQTLGHSVSSLAFSPDGHVVASAGMNNKVMLWEVETGDLLATLKGHASGVTSVGFSPDGRILASASKDHSVKLWDVGVYTGTGDKIQRAPGQWATIAAFSPDSTRLAVGTGLYYPVESRPVAGQIHLFDRTTGDRRRLTTGNSAVLALAFSVDGKLLATGGYHVRSRIGELLLWDVTTGEVQMELGARARPVHGVAFSRDGHLLASAEPEGVQLWDSRSGQALGRLTGHSEAVICVAFSPDGRTLASGSFDQTVKLWDVATQTLLDTLAGHGAGVLSVAFSPDGRDLASSSYDETVKLWDAATGEPRFTLLGHTHWVKSVAFSADGRTLASASTGGEVKMWHVATGDELATLEGHAGFVSIAFSPDGKTLAAGDVDKVVTLWHADGREEELSCR